MTVINGDLSYLSKRENSSILKYTECLDKFSSDFQSQISLKTDTSIFLDANILLRYYSISFVAREKLFQFIKKNHKKIILTQQVQLEFIKNRDSNIQKFFEQVTNKIPKDFNADIVNKMKSFLETHKTVLKDYPFVETGIIKYQEELEKLLEKLNTTSEQKRKDNVDLIVKDKFLDLLKSCTLLESLEEEEIQLVKKDFDKLKKNIKSENIDSILNRPNEVFPGLGDIKEKPSNPYGDYIIFHEMMKYASEKTTDVIFLTFDTTKGDWMSKSKTQYLHYVQNFYSNTKQLVYILDAERSLEEILKINVQSLVSLDNNDDSNDDDLTISSLTGFVETNSRFSRVSKGSVDQKLIEELNLAGYSRISEVERDLERGEIAFQNYCSSRPNHFSAIGILRITLRIVNPKYTLEVNKNGVVKEAFFASEYSNYRKYVLS